ncbi:9807_t:CDS:2, partial [Racocetra persica]
PTNKSLSKNKLPENKLDNISKSPLFFTSANTITIQDHLNRLGSNISQAIIKKNKYIVEEYDLSSLLFKYIGYIYIITEDKEFAT